jgi:diacylglycerol kinase family enzyme
MHRAEDGTSAEGTLPATARPWVGIAANANSGLGSGRRMVERLVAALTARGLEPRVAWTLEDRAELVALARLEAGCWCLVAVGGDGTVADLINELPGVPLAVMPAGTENLFARHFRFPRRPEALAEVIRRARVARLDLGEAGGRRFALMAGFGFDADVVTRHHRARTGRSGTVKPTHRAAYVGPVLQASLEYRFPAVTVRALDPPGEDLVGTTAFVFNLPRYALGLPFAPEAQGDDGLLDLVVFRDPGPLSALRYLWLVLRGLHLRRSGVYHRRVRRVEIEAAATVPVQLDGDPGGTVEPGQPWTVAVLPGAVRLIVPAGMADRSGNLAAPPPCSASQT